MDDIGGSALTLISTVGALIIVLIDKISNKQFFKKLMFISAIPGKIKKQRERFNALDHTLTGMLCSKEMTVRFFNGMDKYDENIIRSFSTSLLYHIRKRHLDSISIDLTQADFPSDTKKVELLLRLINDSSVTKAITIYKPIKWPVLNIPKYPNFVLREVDDSSKALASKTRKRKVDRDG